MATEYVLSWREDTRAFELRVGLESADLILPDGTVVTLETTEWLSVAEMIRKIGLDKKAVTGTNKGSAGPGNAGKAWTEADDAALQTAWSDGNETLTILSRRFGRSAGAIASRLVRLGVASDRKDITQTSIMRSRAASACFDRDTDPDGHADYAGAGSE